MRYRQKIEVPFEYDVVFTRDLFGADNDTLSDVLEEAEAPARVAVFVDEGVLANWPGLLEKIEESARIELDQGSLKFSSRGKELGITALDDSQIRNLTAEQSNTSIIIRDEYILKVYRRLESGTNPDITRHIGYSVIVTSFISSDFKVPASYFAAEPGLLGQTIAKFVNDGQDAWMGMVSVNVPIWFGKLRSQVREKQAQTRGQPRLEVVGHRRRVVGYARPKGGIELPVHPRNEVV